MLRTAVVLLFIGSLFGLLTLGEDREPAQPLAGSSTTLAAPTTLAPAGPATTAPATSTVAGGGITGTTVGGGTTATSSGATGSVPPTTTSTTSEPSVSSAGESTPDALANTGGDGLVGSAVALLGLGLLARRLRRRA